MTMEGIRDVLMSVTERRVGVGVTVRTDDGIARAVDMLVVFIVSVGMLMREHFMVMCVTVPLPQEHSNTESHDYSGARSRDAEPLS